MAQPPVAGSVTAGAFLARLIEFLDTAGIPYMIAGSIASAYHGTPRATQDVDIVIDPLSDSLAAFLDRVTAAGLYVPEGIAREALGRHGQFNVVDPQTGWKADLIVRKERPFSREEFQRRVPARVLGLDVFIASPEDTILSKLEWAMLSGSERQIEDVSGILGVKRGALDTAYIERWAEELGIDELWRRVAGQQPGS
jgi:hypothetical protein